MSIHERRPGGVYRGGEAQALTVDAADAPRILTEESLLPQGLAECLREIAEEASHLVLWVLEVLTMLVLAAVMLLMFKAHAWRGLVGLGTMLGFLTMAASTGGYLISIKHERKGVLE
jgi:hypothetical protein